MTTNYRSFMAAHEAFKSRFKMYAKKVHTERWQGVDISKRPDMVSHELMHETFTINLGMNESLDHWRDDIRPNLPWADDHFSERVCGFPLNPGTQWAHWPWASSADKHREDNMFNHTYMERLWPRYAHRLGPTTTAEEARRQLLIRSPIEAHTGIRLQYGDLRGMVDKFAKEPLSRQIAIPLFFPEDTGADGRMPCTMYYSFLMRGNRLHMFYPLRSCDFVRHWRDDCYLAVRLLLWVLDECRRINPDNWENVTPGDYTMHMSSFHIFANDFIALKEGRLP